MTATGNTRRRFQATANGLLPYGTALEPNGVYEIVRRTPPAAFSIDSSSDLSNWIDECVLGDLRSLVIGARQNVGKSIGAVTARRFGGGNFYLAAGCCMALEYVARVYCDLDNATSRVAKYVQDFLVPINQKYSKYWTLVWLSLRNGIIHGAWPQSICLEGDEKKRIGFAIGMEPSHLHLSASKSPEGHPTLFVSSLQLFSDIEASIHDGFFDWLRTVGDPDTLSRGAARLQVIRKGSRQAEVEFHQALREVDEGK